MDIPKLLNYIDEQMKSTYVQMEERVCDLEMDATEDDILSVTDDLSFSDQCDSDNHNYDLGRYKTLSEIKRLIQEDNHTAQSILDIMKMGCKISFNSNFRFESDLEGGYIKMYHSHGSAGMIPMDIQGAKLALDTEKSYRELISNG